jgi:hypothetical protein
MTIKRVLILVLFFSCVLLLFGLSQGFAQAKIDVDPDTAVSTWTFQGRVYTGEMGDESQPQPGVLIAVFGSQEPYPDEGVIIRETVTNDEGWFGIDIYDDDGIFSTYHIRAFNPPGTRFSAAATVDGTVRDNHWIEFNAPLDGQTLSGNHFWLRHEADLPIGEIPRPTARQAAQLLETVRGTAGAPGWEDAGLYPFVRPLFRPDLPDPAYFEFRVRVGDEPAGFIIIASGEHDFPITHWNFSGQSPSDILLEKARSAGHYAVKFYKLDALDYAAEDEAGDLAANLGSMPVKVSGMDPAWLEQTPPTTDVNWLPDPSQLDDDNPPTSGTKEVVGPEKEKYQLGGWQSWHELKSQYSDSYGVLLEDLRRSAAEDWQIEKLARQFGEGLVKGQTIWIPLLCEISPQVEIVGLGTELVETEQIVRGGQPVLRLTVLDSIPGAEMPLDIVIRCPQNPEEILSYWIVADAGSLYLPVVSASNPSLNRSGLDRSQAVQGYQIAWVWMDYREQMNYYQLSFYPPPGVSSCPSGCGATAWAMLFGWADNQADSLHWSYWRPRWGIYRQNGGYGVNARAPFFMDAGTKNMTWDIRDDIDTWCAFGSAPTFPSDMDEASDYLKGRSGTKISTHYNVFGVKETRLRNYASHSIMYRSTPAIIGTGWLKHYPLAYGYQWWSRKVKKCFIWCWTTTEYSRQFWVNQGNGGSGNGWISASTWFAGEIYP